MLVRKDELMTFETNKQKLSERSSGQAIYENVFNYITAKNNDENCPLNKANYSTEFVKKIIAIYFKRGDVVLDTFGGTGTTAVACGQCGIDCYSFEISSKQCEWANNRIQQETAQMNIFDFI